MKTVAVYRSNYLALSETFISDHLRSLKTYRPVVITEFDQPAAHRVELQPHTIWGGNWGRKAFSRMGISPGLDAFVKKEQPALLHAHFLTDAARIVPYIERTKLPFIVTAHGYDATTYDDALKNIPEGRLLLQRAKRIAQAARAIVCVSDYIRDILIDRGYPSEKLVTLPLGVDVDLIKPRSESKLGSGIVTVGRLTEKKGTRYLIEAYAKLPEAVRLAHALTIIGDGYLRKDLEALAQSLGVEVMFKGGLSRSEVLEQITNARVFAFPSIRAKNGDAEGMGIAIMEAMALGVPVVIFKGQPMAKYLEASKAGLLAEDFNVDEVASALSAILTDDDVARELSSTARNLCEREFSLYANTRKLETLYDDCL